MAKATKRQPKKSAEPKVAKNVRVKTAKDMVQELDTITQKVIHKNTGKSFSKKTQKTIVSYGPWLTALIVFVGVPELLVFAKTGETFGLSGLFDMILFNQQAWLLMIIILANFMLLADGLSDVFNKKKRGWNRVYAVLIISALYCIMQLLKNLTAPAAPIISIGLIAILLFTIYDVRPYYTK